MYPTLGEKSTSVRYSLNETMPFGTLMHIFPLLAAMKSDLFVALRDLGGNIAVFLETSVVQGNATHGA